MKPFFVHSAFLPRCRCLFFTITQILMLMVVSWQNIRFIWHTCSCSAIICFTVHLQSHFMSHFKFNFRHWMNFLGKNLKNSGSFGIRFSKTHTFNFLYFIQFNFHPIFQCYCSRAFVIDRSTAIGFKIGKDSRQIMSIIFHNEPICCHCGMMIYFNFRSFFSW